MKKTSLLTSLSVVAAMALTLSACGGQSVEDARADAYATLDSMEGLTTSQNEEYQADLNSAADQAAIDHILANAQSDNDEQLAKKAAASASAAATEAAKASLEEALAGVTLVGTSAECEGMTITFNADGTWSGDAGESEDCLGFTTHPINGSDYTERADTWQVSADGQAIEIPYYAAIRAYYAVSIDGGSYSFEVSPFRADSSSTAGVEGTHTFVIDSSPSAS